MLKNILKLNRAQELSKNEQKMTLGGGGGSSCSTYDPQKCERCGGIPLPNGCCLGDAAVHSCLTGNIS